MKRAYLFINIYLTLISTLSFGQIDKKREIEHQTLFGLNISPISAGNFIRNNDINYTNDSINYNIRLKNSISFGGEIRHYFTYRFAIISGILFTRRNIEVDYNSKYSVQNRTKTDTNFTRDLKFIAYEIPVHALGYVRLTNQIYMSIAGGLNLNFYPSHIKTNNVYVQRVGTKIGKYAWQFFQLGYTANIGFEYRTNDLGTFYIGASYQARTDIMARIGVYEKITIHRPNYQNQINGDYFSINLKYFFPFVEKNSHRNHL